MAQKLRLPKDQRTVKDSYIEYAESILEANPTFWSKYSHKTPHYKVYRQEPGKVIEVISYPLYREVIETYFKLGAQYIIEGYALSLGSRLGRIAPRRVERSFKNKKVNWKDTKIMWEKKGERKGLVYFTDEEYLRIGWKKTGKLKNSFLYRFDAAAGNKSGTGFKLEFTRANQKDPLLRLKYEFFPYIKEDKVVIQSN